MNIQSPGVFLMNFRLNLADISDEPFLYGSYSFRRGGAQYFSSEKRLGIRKLCDWGGWSMDFDSLTIVRYLVGSNDDPVLPREDFLNPAIKQGRLCHVCGRSCDCYA